MNLKDESIEGAIVLRYYLTLGVSYPTTDDAVRRAYLELVKRFPPERNPEEFARITEAYEALKDETGRIHLDLRGFVAVQYPEEELLLLGRVNRKRGEGIGLADLIEFEKRQGTGHGCKHP